MATRRAAPQRAAGAQPVARQSGRRGATATVSPDSVSQVVQPRLRKRREKILLCGDVYVGKSYAYMRLAQLEFERESNWDERSGAGSAKDDTGSGDPDSARTGVQLDRVADPPSEGAASDAGSTDSGTSAAYTGPKFWVLDCDDTCPTFLEDGAEFAHLYYQNGGNVYPYPAGDWMEAITGFHAICKKESVGDWIILDPGNRLYEFAQDHYAELHHFDKDQREYERHEDGKGFGAFEGVEWNAIKRMLWSILRRAAFQAKSHLIITAHIDDITEYYAKRAQKTLYSQIGLAPKGPKEISGMMNSIVFLWAARVKDADNKGASTIRKMTIVKDRGGPVYKTLVYDKDFYPSLLKQRLKAAKDLDRNVTDPKEVAEREEIEGGEVDNVEGEVENPLAES